MYKISCPAQKYNFQVQNRMGRRQMNMDFKRNKLSDRSSCVALMRKALLVCGLLLIMATAAACSSTDYFADSDGKVKVTATIGMIADIVGQVGKEHVTVIGLMGPGVDPHLYKASQGDIAKLDQADIIFYNGLHLEGKMIEIFERMSKQKPTVAVSRGIEAAELRKNGPDDTTEYDPHIWFNVSHWMSAVREVRDALAGIDPDHAAAYQDNAEAYLAQLEQLHQEVHERIASIPEQSRVLVTAHDAFGYFGDEYGIQVMGLQGMSTASETGSKDVADLRDYLIENRIKAVFIESSVPPRGIEAVIQGAKKLGHEILIGGELYSDAMGAAGTTSGTYIGMVRHNVDTIVNALR